MRSIIFLAMAFCVGLAQRPLPAADKVKLVSATVVALDGAERDRFLAAHNAARNEVGTPPLAWSGEIAKYAQDWLTEQKEPVVKEAIEGWEKEKIVLPEHHQDGKYGENIAAWGGSKLEEAEYAVALWLREKKAFDKLNAEGSYKYGDEEGQKETDKAGKERPVIVGHYTAITWRTTTHVGAAKLVFELADDAGQIRRFAAVVCNYDPPGNRRGKKPF